MTLQRYQDYLPGDRFADMSAGLLQHGQDQVRQLGNINVGPGLQLRKTPSGTSITLAPSEERRVVTGITVTRFIVIAVNGNTLDCKGVGEDEIVTVAQPIDLQVQTYAFKERNFTNESGRITNVKYTPTADKQRRLADVRIDLVTARVTERIAPPYATGATEDDNDQILVVSVGEDVTGVEGVELIDWNSAGRAWAELD